MIVPLTAPAHLDAALAAPLAVVYKHSPRCGVCIAAEREVRHFAQSHPDVPVYWLDVVVHPGLALEVASRLAIRHESPQAILVASGTVRLAASHWDVRAADLDHAAAPVPSGPAGGGAAR
jgi:bacillithiol system protein YtxJ